MADYLSLIRQRVEAQARPTVRVQVCLVPDLLTELADARKAAAVPARAEAGRRIGDPPAEPNPEARARLANVEQQVLDATLVVVLQALTTADLAASRAGTDLNTTTQGEYWVRDLTQAFGWAEDGNGNRATDVGRTEWGAILSVTPAAEVQYWHAQLSKAGQAPDFPTSAKS